MGKDHFINPNVQKTHYLTPSTTSHMGCFLFNPYFLLILIISPRNVSKHLKTLSTQRPSVEWALVSMHSNASMEPSLQDTLRLHHSTPVFGIQPLSSQANYSEFDCSTDTTVSKFIDPRATSDLFCELCGQPFLFNSVRLRAYVLLSKTLRLTRNAG